MYCLVSVVGDDLTRLVVTANSQNFRFPPLSHFSNDVDVIVFSVFENGAHHCTDTPVGTYITPVQHYLQGVLDQKQQDMEDQGYEDYELAEVSQYVACTPMEIQNNMYYFQVGCADDSHQALAVNIYQDNTCTTRSAVDGFDDANIDASDIQASLFLVVVEWSILEC